MKAVIQRVSQAEVRIGSQTISSIRHGLLILLCVLRGDTELDGHILEEKIPGLRIFGDSQGRMDRSLLDVGGELLLVSQVTLAADLKKGLRPSFDTAADPETAQSLYHAFSAGLQRKGVRVQTGRFGAMMQITLVNDGPVTFVLDTRR